MHPLHPRDCPGATLPGWEYKDHPRHDPILNTETVQVLVALRSGAMDTSKFTADTRPVHYRLFRDLVPAGYAYFAGHYRGESYRCLQYYTVGIQNDPRVGYPPEGVLGSMEKVAQEVQTTLKVLDAAIDVPNSRLPREEKLKYVVAFACHMLELFFTIHPYANGNGHMGRFMVWSILGRYGYWPKRWPLHPRPPDPPYSHLIAQYRDGDRDPLEIYMLKALA
jgi:fido (protein-threonine AMPylation protein)